MSIPGQLAILWLVICSLASAASAAQTATLAWDADTDPTVAGYRLYYGTSSGTYSQMIDVGNSATAKVSSLQAGKTYYFVVTAYDALGLESPPSNEASFNALDHWNFNGLITNASPSTSNTGSIQLALLATGRFTGTAKIAGSTVRLSGVFNNQGEATLTIAQPKQAPIALTLNLDPTSGEITGSIAQGTAFSSAISASRAAFSKTDPAPQAGAYTVLLPANTASPTSGTVPAGNGYGRLVVSRTGIATLAGRLGDGSPIALSAALAVNGSFPIFARLYSGKGLIAGVSTFESITATGAESDLNGTLQWIAPQNRGAFSSSITMIGSRFVQPSKKPPMLTPLLTSAPALGTVTLANCDLQVPLVEDVSLGSATITVQNPGVDKLEIRINSATGLFTGSFYDSSSRSQRTLLGAVFQKRSVGAGQFGGWTESGSVVLTENP